MEKTGTRLGRNIPPVRRLADAAMDKAWAIEETRPDDRKALFEAYLAAARLGKMEAMTNVGLHFLYGDGVRRDPKRSRMWTEKAAGLGDDVAAFNLGLAYDNGRGARKNKGLAEVWYRRAAAMGFAIAEGNLAYLLFESTEPHRQQEAVRLYRKHARQGHPIPAYNVGLAYELGKGVRKNLKRANAYYESSAKGGYAEAQLALGYNYSNGVGLVPDAMRAFGWFRLAAKQGHASASFNLGLMFANGEGVPKSKARALRHFRDAADLGHAKAARWLRKLEKA
ncbi:tetratricopeptide repeat protein [Corallococcus carmarthensis]|uniref:tetratricopeptide repeat protein n=1 Tax=Corallococcus carmarthensis TaxID=2316728 RepID=UPI0020A43A54|nr:tetratricopeptide repeat protein [Corallococcus carmarthensis]